MKYRISLQARRDQEAHVKAGYPGEACGLLIGTETASPEIITAFQAKNLNKERVADRYELDPEDFLRGEKFARDRNQQVLGIFHSHPDCPNLPSEFDRQRAWEGYLYVIVSVYKGEVKDFNGWVLNWKSEQFEEVEIEFFGD